MTDDVARSWRRHVVLRGRWPARPDPRRRARPHAAAALRLGRPGAADPGRVGHRLHAHRRGGRAARRPSCPPRGSRSRPTPGGWRRATASASRTGCAQRGEGRGGHLSSRHGLRQARPGLRGSTSAPRVAGRLLPAGRSAGRALDHAVAVLLPAESDEAVWDYFATANTPTEPAARALLDSAGRSDGTLSVPPSSRRRVRGRRSKGCSRCSRSTAHAGWAPAGSPPATPGSSTGRSTPGWSPRAARGRPDALLRPGRGLLMGFLRTA